MSRYDETGRSGIPGGWIAAGVLGLLIAIGGCMGLYPQYSVYSAEKEGQAEYAKAESSRRISVLEAQAKLDSASKLAEAEVARAHGVAQANQIIGKSLEGNEAYLRYLWIMTLEQGKNDVVYVPTEANLPILEADRHRRHQEQIATEQKASEEKK